MHRFYISQLQAHLVAVDSHLLRQLSSFEIDDACRLLSGPAVILVHLQTPLLRPLTRVCVSPCSRRCPPPRPGRPAHLPPPLSAPPPAPCADRSDFLDSCCWFSRHWLAVAAAQARLQVQRGRVRQAGAQQACACLQVIGPAAIPQFHFPNGRPLSREHSQAVQNKLDHLFVMYPHGLTVPAIKDLVKEVCDAAVKPPTAAVIPHSCLCLTDCPLLVRPDERGSTHLDL